MTGLWNYLALNVGPLIDNYHKRNVGARDLSYRENDRTKIESSISLSLCLLSSIPLLLWLLTTMTEFLFHKCTQIQRKLSLIDCIQILDNYSDKDTADDLDDSGYANPQNLFWYSNEGDANGNDRMQVIDTRDDVRINVNRRTEEETAVPYRSDTSFSYESHQKAERMLHLHKTYCYSGSEDYHATRRYLRGNFILALVATMKLLLSCIMITLSLFALNTDPLTVLAFTGVAWTALWFQGGVVDLSRNYLYYFVLLISDKFHPGNIVMLEGYMKEPGCIYRITPLYTVFLIKRENRDARAEELLFLDVMNYNFFVYPQATAFRWKKLPKRTKQNNTKIIASTLSKT